MYNLYTALYAAPACPNKYKYIRSSMETVGMAVFRSGKSWRVPVEPASPDVLPDEPVPPPADQPGALQAPAVQGQEDSAQHQVVLAGEQVVHLRLRLSLSLSLFTLALLIRSLNLHSCHLCHLFSLSTRDVLVVCKRPSCTNKKGGRGGSYAKTVIFAKKNEER